MVANFRRGVSFNSAEIESMLATFRDILESGELSLGSVTQELEMGISEVTGARHAVACSSGAAALEIVLRAVDITGRTVLVPANSNFATAASVHYAGGQIEFYDNGLYPDVDALMGQIRPELGAVIVVHIGGYVSPDIDLIAVRCRSLGIPLIEDAAHALGARLDTRSAGTFGTAAIFSMFPSKPITTGEGGVIITRSEELAGLAMRLRNQGKSADGSVNDLYGNSWRMTELGAAVGVTMLARLELDVLRKVAILDRYERAFRNVSDISLVPVARSMRPSGYKAVAMLASAETRDLLKEQAALERGVFDIPLVAQPVFAHLAAGRKFRLAYSFANSHVCLPTWRGMTDADVDHVISDIERALEGPIDTCRPA